VTNLSMILPGLYGMYTVTRDRLELRFFVSYFMLFLVGVGSTLFHMTLQYWGQMLDELPMVYSSCAFIYSLKMIEEKKGESDKRLVGLLIIYSFLFSAVYLTFPFPIIHQVLYGIMIVIMIYLGLVHIVKTRDTVSIKLFFGGVITFLVAFIMWNLDNHFCSSLQTFRASAPAYISPISQLHGWWHILTGYATYLSIQFSIYNRLKNLELEPKFSYSTFGVSINVDSHKEN